MNGLSFYYYNKQIDIEEREHKVIELYQPVNKDILIIVHNQLEWLKTCINSIMSHTENFFLYIWDNNSNQDVVDYLKTIPAHVHRSEENMGFIKPNNYLASISKSPYLILLNSDTKVTKGWDKVLIGALQLNPILGQVGFMGGKLDKECKGTQLAWGADIDFVSGWCSCIARKTYEEFGLFDEQNLIFAYGEDADFSLKLKEKGKKIYAFYSTFVHHEGNQTILEIIEKEGDANLRKSFEANHNYLRSRWGHLINAGI